jgi:uncharacterized repeat protein (TIGR01451 family)
MMTAATHDAQHTAIADSLPAWWRLLLMAIATIILCSCGAPHCRAQETDTAGAAAIDTDADAPESSMIIIDRQPFADDPPPDYSIPHESTPIPMSDDAITVGPDEAFICDSDHMFGGRADGAGSCTTWIADPYGPWIGPSDEYLCDGGDFVSPAGVRADWVIEGLEQEDAIAHYDTVDGRVIVVPSNRVCIYAPRFAAVRRVVSAIAHEQPLFVNVMLEEESPAKAAESQPVASSLQRHAVAINLAERPPILFRQRQQAGQLEQLVATMDVFLSVAAYANLHIIRTGQVDNAEKPRLATSIESAITWTGAQAPQVIINAKRAQEMVGVRRVGVVYHTDGPDRPRLRLVKLASCGHALPGEEVEFVLRFDNIGDQVIGNVTIVDNLSTRLEYIPDSAQSSVDARFVTEPNDAGSTILRWEITDPVKPGEGGVLRFRTRVR